VLDFQDSVVLVKYLWPRPDHYEWSSKSTGVVFEFHHNIKGSLVIAQNWFCITKEGKMVFRARRDWSRDTDKNELEDYAAEKETLDSICSILSGFAA
jgi:hypothetical protein